MAESPAVATLIEKLGLEPLPVEGGYFAVTYRSPRRASALPHYTGERCLAGAIYYLATSEQFSALHRLATDEVYFYHGGDPLQMLCLYDDGRSEVRLLGCDVGSGQVPQFVVPCGQWHGSRPKPGGSYGYSLCGTSMAPAYEADDVEFAKRETLLSGYPQRAELIAALTRIAGTPGAQ